MSVKKCVQCQEEKPIEAFALSSDKRIGRVHPYSQGCKECINRAKSVLRWLRRGANRLSFQERFEQYVEPVPWGGCWIWTGASTVVNGHRHGLFNVQATSDSKKVASAYRVAWELYVGEIPEGMCVLHSCDNRLCVNPMHLWLGTMKDNTHDMIRKGRHPVMKTIRGATQCQ